ncbi:unnamed protein product (macronuclear) [Paramecium tetraurelia]|uniref:Uncharacterized protein n=1 Tax=Paramecium tetraurelia TaxID=5888 RepID=A0E229_PARTE|nr:uncharacterized protein GSPATT00022517001 [Paramecium tetraurelia]CAK89346.1 unnamed protein product [Paramecium tetraurelia]|eukprot:XP_001456743.1 hypothetical protein (macronuclear) [Paramecium tetraurelia strain d4-2]
MSSIYCQAISYLCVSDGNACIEAKICKEYSQTQCETTPSISGILKCKWDTTAGTCRDYSCSEADVSLNTDIKCSDWLAGCVTKGQGCVNSPRPSCTTYTGDDAACQSYIGSDGNCELATGTTNCKAKECANAPTSLSTDDDCKAYQKGCITTGKGCVQATTKPLCSSYSGDNTTCVGYVGSDGICEGDAGGSKCRQRKCENGAFNTDDLCKQYQSTCKTNGKACVSSLSACNTYKGTATTCAVYIGTDGYCKGTSTTAEAACAPKVCDEALDTTTTDEACAKYQVGCVTTGKGCISKTNLKSCTTYDGDATSCQSRVGSEGKCTWKSGTKCVARDCVSAPSSVNTNPLCANYFTKCVTTGSGCVSQTTCDLTVKQQSCEGTDGCSWQPICTSNAQCSDFKKKSICLANQARVETFVKYDDNGKAVYNYVSTKCGWLNNACKVLACSDLTGAYYNNDANCQAELPSCISNRVDGCITKQDCGKLFGNQATCLSYPGYCTNVSTATETTACIQKKCSDNTDTNADNAACATFLPGCISNGKGCIDYTTLCTSMKGTQETCNKLYAYKSGGSFDTLVTNQCYNTSTATENDFCQVKTCKLATNQTDSSCGQFLEGCVYNGNGGCVDPKASDTSCGSYTGVSAFCSTAIVKDNSAGYCFGTATSGTCTQRQCTDDTTSTKDDQCDTFLSGCIAKSDGGCAKRDSRSCAQQTGTVTTCSNFSGGLQVDSKWNKIACVKYDACQLRGCTDKTNPQTAQDCYDYKTSCRFFKAGAACIDAVACSSYTLPDTATTEQQKFDYCTGTKNASGILCGYTKGATKCSDRTCDQFLSTYTTLACSSYLQKNVSTTGDDVCSSAGTYCYLQDKTDCAYAFPSGILEADKLSYCQKFKDKTGILCSYKTSDAACSAQDTCEKVVSQTSAVACNDVLVYEKAICQRPTPSTKCLSTVTACSAFTLETGLTDANKKTICESLRPVDATANFGTGTAVYSWCTWVSGANCADITCSAIQSPTSQTDCDKKKTGCYYYASKCYDPVAANACPTTFPTGVDTDIKKVNYCKSVYETAKGFCEIKKDGSGCQTGANDKCTVILTDAWTGNFMGAAVTTAAICPTLSSNDKTKLCIKDGDTACKAGGTCEDIPSPNNQGDCDLHLKGCVYAATKCRTPKLATIAAAGDCAKTTIVPFAADVTGLSGSEKTAYCQIFSQDGTQLFCTYDQYNDTTQTVCADAGNCDTYKLPTGDEARKTYCLSKITAAGKKCGFTAGKDKCRDFDCQDISSPTSQVDCDLNSNKLKCFYFKGTCVNHAATCDVVPVVGGTLSDKQAYCKGLGLTDKCTYSVGAYCAKVDACDKYSVKDVTDKTATCGTLVNATGAKCTYIQGDFCVKQDTCDKYDGSTPVNGPEAGKEEAQCKAVKSTTGYPCIVDSTKPKLCKAQTCADNNASAAECSSNAADCLYYQSKCISKNTCGGYTPVGDDPTAKQTWCEGVQNSTGDYCAWDSATSKCKDRGCGDKQFYTDFDCQNYLKACKTDGTKCVAVATACTSFSGSGDYCNGLLDPTGKDKCKPLATATTTISACANRTCYDNVTAESDPDCDTYLSGCVTRGKGCIPNTVACTAYRGTKTQCEAFKQYTGVDANKNPIYVYCSGDASNIATSACKSRTCADNTTSTSDTECAQYLKGCITKGTGCVDATSQCTVFKGLQTTCSKFMGNSGKDYCWNASNAVETASCQKKKCTDISGKNNDECQSGMPVFKKGDDPFCVYDGAGCVDYGKICSQFNGTEETCPSFLAKDGPCKATTVGTIKGACAKRVCTEAPNTITTDAECQKYHSSCYTTGYGCSSVKQCSNLTSQASCKLREECTWANLCASSSTTCSTFNGQGYSQCTNSKVNGKFCAWQESSSTCRAQVCEDQPATIASHAQCQAFSDNCTTTGAGCITITTCPLYKTQSICVAASASKDGVQRCGWDATLNKCRARACSDKNGLTDDECNTFLAGCKTNGVGCVAGTSCTEFTNKSFCLISKAGPCLWVNQSCYDYDRCEDAVKKSHPECQAFSPLCTTNGETCIPITSCANTAIKASCVVGTDGPCGWLPTGKCQKFGLCTDAVAATNDECMSYGTTCITDGAACIAKTTCGSYKTQTACNNNGTDGICYWNATANTCKLKECGDEQKGTNDQCKLISVTGGSCTTDGTKCIPLSTCSSYLEAGCFTGTDGECTFALPIGATTGTKACRQKQCEDITGGTSNANCTGIITGKSCVSNGTNCIAKAACSTYKTLTSCNGGGLENNKATVCAFTPTGTDKVNGTCKTFTACADAVKDKLACSTNLSCKWTENSTGTSCANHACDTFATGTDCRPIPSFDGTSSTVCVLQSGKCAAADPGTMTDAKICYVKSAYTYSWNSATNKCESCISGSVNPNNSNGTNNNTDNGTTTTDSAFILSAISLGLLGLMA